MFTWADELEELDEDEESSNRRLLGVLLATPGSLGWRQQLCTIRENTSRSLRSSMP